MFLIYVNDLPDWILASMRLFADDIKISTPIQKMEDSMLLQSDMDTLSVWSDTWLLRFRIDKCKVMHIGHKQPTKYYLKDGGKSFELAAVEEEKDLGIHTTSDLRPSLHCSKAAAKASSILGMIRRNFKRIDKEDFRLLYKTYVRPHLEYCVQAWSPSLAKDKACLEKVQRRATKMVDGLWSRSYEERLEILGLTTLEKRRQRGDLIETYKILTGRERVNSGNFFQRAHAEYNLLDETVCPSLSNNSKETFLQSSSHCRMEQSTAACDLSLIHI